MAVREFDSSVSDNIITAIGALSGMTHGTVGGIVQVADTANLKTLLGLHDSGAAAQVSFGLDFNEFNYWWVHGAERVEGQPLTAGTWYLWIIRKDTGNLVPRSSLRDMTAGTWDHGFVNNDVIDSIAPGVGGDTRFSAGAAEFFDGRIAIRAVWSNSLPWAADAVGDTAIEAAGLETAASNWDAANPSAGWVFNQSSTSESVSDFTGGGADQTSLSGTTVITGDDPPGFTFDLAQEVSIEAQPGTAHPAGQPAVLTMGHRLDAQPANAAPAGQQASLTLGHRLDATPGAAPPSGQHAALTLGHRLDAQSGAAPPVGQVATFALQTAEVAVDALAGIALPAGQHATFDGLVSAGATRPIQPFATRREFQPDAAVRPIQPIALLRAIQPTAGVP